MSSALVMNEWEALPELAPTQALGSNETDGEWAAEGDQEEFFRTLAGLAGKAIENPTIRRLGLNAARMALRGGLGAGGAWLGGRVAGPDNRVLGSAAGGGLGYGLGTALGSLLPDEEGAFEFEDEGAFEDELGLGEEEMNPIRLAYPEAVLEHLGHAAAEADNEDEAVENFLPLIPMAASALLPMAMKALPLAAKLAPKILSSVMRVTPQLSRGVSGVTRMLYRNRRTRPLLRTLPTIARRTTSQLLQRAAQGGPITPQYAARALAQQTSRVIGDPQQSVIAYRRSRRLDRCLHAPGSPLMSPAQLRRRMAGLPY